MPKRKKIAWSEEEDCNCIKAVKDFLKSTNEYKLFQDTNKLPVGFPWKKVSKTVPTRDGKQCRERWNNQLAPGIIKSPWTKEEDKLLKSLHKEHSSKWKFISESIPGRPENQCKMRWKALFTMMVQGLDTLEVSSTLKDKELKRRNSFPGQIKSKRTKIKKFRTSSFDEDFEDLCELESFLSLEEQFESLSDFDSLLIDEVTHQTVKSNSIFDNESEKHK